MSDMLPVGPTHRRTSSGSTVKASDARRRDFSGTGRAGHAPSPVQVNLWVHDDAFSTEDVLINESFLTGSGIVEGSLIEIVSIPEASEIRDFQSQVNDGDTNHAQPRESIGSKLAPDQSSRYLCLARFAQAEFKAKQANLQMSIKSNIAAAFGFRSRSQVEISLADFNDWTASHVELGFRDAYLARSDMWRLVGQELAGKIVYTGQKITFLGSIKVVVKAIHVRGHKVPTAFFSGNTVPVFRSEAARYIVFIQMSREMWDFDSEGNGEILFNKVINGFLPDLFKRWTELEVRHLVSIVLFGRIEYDRDDLQARRETISGTPTPFLSSNVRSSHHQDFYKVVVTDMASAQWTTILDELKKDFRVFLRDVSLYPPRETDMGQIHESTGPIKITGRPSTAMKGNILEAINIASSQFARDYVDRDLIRTGISVVVITAGTGVFEVDRNLLSLTSENLTNNGIGIDVVCLSKMPLHSVPLFKYRTNATSDPQPYEMLNGLGKSPHNLSPALHRLSAAQSQTGSPVLSSITSSSTQHFSRLASSFSLPNPHTWSYGIPHWIDLSYWASEDSTGSMTLDQAGLDRTSITERQRKGPFVPRVRMYEVQMMGLMEMGMADISIPFMSEAQHHQRQRRKRTKSNAHRTGSTSLSHSPTVSRKGRMSISRAQFNPGLLSTNAKALGDTFERMDEYDNRLYHQAPRSKLSRSPEKETKNIQAKKMGTDAAKVLSSRPGTATGVSEGKPPPDQTPPPQLPPTTPSATSGNIGINKKSPEVKRAVRYTSYALRGLAPPIRAVASTEVNVENALAQPSRGSPAPSHPTLASSSGSIRSFSVLGSSENNEKLESMEETSPRTMPVDDDMPSRPIRINHSGRDTAFDKPTSLLSKQVSQTGADPGAKQHSDAESVDKSNTDSSEGEGWTNFGAYGSFPSSVPKSTLPFIRNVNASNPLKRHPNNEAFFGRWQHLYPRKPRAATVKWRSLCTPASVPLTTEDFPPKTELESEYDTTSYTVALEASNDLLEEPETRDKLLREMLSLRFAHGYQLVVGSRLTNTTGPGLCDPSFFFDPDRVRPTGEVYFMSMGNTLQKLTLVESNKITVTRYVRKRPQAHSQDPLHVAYDPHIKTILSDEYKPRRMELRGFSEQYPWELADTYLGSAKKDLEDEVELLRFWRARFILLPVEPPASTWRAGPSESEENEEEIHLRGIRALTQMWQKSRYVPPDERRPAHNRMSAMKRKDRNPLRINMETLNPSELVATELDKLLSAEDGGEVQTTQLLPEAEQFERETATLAKLAAAIQGERGIEIKNRRWHLRLHYSCFQGEEFTNWLVHNFRDIDTRGEAVEFGNDLMKEGLFEHVNSRHNFKDGNYFYSIKADWRTARPELRQSWLPSSRRTDRSIPPTPLSDNVSKESSLAVRSRSGSSMAAPASAPPSSELAKTFSDKKRLAVSLSKVIKLDVDHRRRSNRPEIINLHYDRLHNPENCYHLELAWLNVTSKLVDDAIVAWTSQAEKYGLKLVEVPIAEACEVPNNEPFRAPYRIKLVTEPPQRSSTSNVFFTATSFGPQVPLNSDVHLYQKTLLRRFNFVLDLEALSEFPENVDISYSWGRLEYRYTQFIHRSGVILAQITDEGDFLLLANRLYNSRLASTKDTAASKFDSKKDNTNNNSAYNLRPPLPPSMQASGIIGLNVQSPSPHPSPRVRPSPMSNHDIQPLERQQPQRASADVLGSRRALGTSGLATFVTPEQIKDDLEAFCHDRDKLEAFYREVTLAQQTPRKIGSTGTATTGSGMLRPSGEPDPVIPEFSLPEAVTVTSPTTIIASPTSGGPRRKGTG